MPDSREPTGSSEMQLSNTATVTSTTSTTKTTGLNPNANVFHIKNPTTPPPDGTASAALTEWLLTPETPTNPEPAEALNNGVASTADSFAFMNGDGDSSSRSPASAPGAGGSTTFPPTPESPLSVGQADFAGMNGTLEGQVLFPLGSSTAADGSVDENTQPLDGTIPDDQLRSLLRSQLEYYFCRDNLANDSYLVSQMDADQYVAIATIAGFNQVRKLTNNLQLVIEVLRESAHVQVDEVGEKVRPLHKRCIVILREIPNTTPVEAVKKLFSGASCPPFVSCEFAHNDNWYVTFDSEEEAQKAYRYLREEVGTFLGKPIMARIKAKPLLRSSFVPKNGFKQQYEQQPSTFTPQAPASQKFQFPASVASVPFLQAGQQGFPFFPANPASAATVTPNTIPQVWPPSPQLAFYDPATAFSVNGYTPAGTIKPQTSSRHGFQSMRNVRNQKPHRGGSSGGVPVTTSGVRANDAASHPSSVSQPPPAASAPEPTATSSSATTTTTATSGGDDHERLSAAVSSSRYQGRPRSEGSYHHRGGYHHNHHHHHHAHGGSGIYPGPPPPHGGHAHGYHHHNHHHNHHSGDMGLGGGPRHSSMSDVSKDGFSQPLAARRPGGYRGRRRRGHEENGATTNVSTDIERSASTSSLPSAKDKPTCDPPNFDLADTSFPPLPGSLSNTSSSEVFENKMSDVVKGTAKPLTRDVHKPPPPSPPAPASSPPPPGPSPPTPGAAPADTGAAKPATVAQIVAAPPPKEPKSGAVTASVSAAAPSVSVTTATSATPTAACPASVLTPPQSPLKKVSKSTSTDTCPLVAAAAPSDAGTVAPAPDSASVSTQTTDSAAPHTSTAAPGATSTATSVSTQAGNTNDDAKSSKKLSYAEMAQRGKDKKPVEKAKDEGSSKDQNGGAAGDSVTATPAATSKDPAATAKSPTHEARRDDQRPSYAASRRPREYPPREYQQRDYQPREYQQRRDEPRKDYRNGGTGYFRDRDDRDRKGTYVYDRSRGK